MNAPNMIEYWLVVSVLVVIVAPALTFGMWWLYFRLVPRVSDWIIRKIFAKGETK